MKPLEGVKVVELSAFVAAPTAARVMADWGAEVIKVEPLTGDAYRKMGPTMMIPIWEDGNPCFDNHNLNKKYITLNLKVQEGMDTLFTLLEQADVLITNYRLDALERLGLTYEDLKDRFPQLIHARVLGYGNLGPEKDKPGFDYTAFYAKAGVMADLTPKGSGPVNPVPGLGDQAVSISLVAGICAALHKRLVAGTGEKVECGLYQTGIFLMSSPIQSAYYGQNLPRDHFSANQATTNSYCCKDGEWIFISASVYDKLWPVICKKVINRPELAEDERFCNQRIALKNKRALIEILDEIFLTKPQAEWVDLLKKADIPHERVQHCRDIMTDPQALENHYIREYAYSDEHKTWFSNSPVDFSSIDVSREIPKVAGPLGEDTDQVLKDHGYTEEQIAALRNNQVIL